MGNRRYLEDWSNDVAKIAKHQIKWVQVKLEDQDSSFTKAFNRYLDSLRHNINDQISKNQAVEMIAQHIITKPVFDALFNNNDFVLNNPVSKAMQGIVIEMEKAGFKEEQKSLEPFYHSVKLRASGIDNANDKQEFIKTLYNDFFSQSFKSSTSRLGIVFTPVPIVNFIIHSVDYALHKYFGKSLASEGVHILDPFVGTGTFITQTLYYLADLYKQGKIKLSDIVHKYTQELHCNEIVLLSYYIAAINIESVFNEIVKNKKYQEFKGIVLTDTFESTERNYNVLDKGMFNDNNKRLNEERKQPITVIMSNPPYSKGKTKANDNSKNDFYPKLDDEIKKEYHSHTSRLYNSYIRAIRWSSDRISSKGIIGFVTDAQFLTSASMDGLRKNLYKEFNYLYIYNLRGNQRIVGDARLRGGAPVFDAINGTGGSKSPIAISILIKDGSNNHQIFYHSVPDYLLTSKAKLNDINHWKAISNMPWQDINPNSYNDWINQRDPSYSHLYPLKRTKNNNSLFNVDALGIITNRDPWAYNFSKSKVISNMRTLISHYNQERIRIHRGSELSDLSTDSKYIDWSSKLRRLCKNNKILKFHRSEIIEGAYRPFVKKWLYFDKDTVECPRLYFDDFGKNNISIDITGMGANRDFSVLATKYVPDDGFVHHGQGFIRFNNKLQDNTLLKFNRDNINRTFAKRLKLTTTNTFYYVYGILNSPDYQKRYKNDLKNEIARIPIVKNILPFVQIGKKLMALHTNYENVAPYKNLNIKFNSQHPSYYVTHIKHGTYHGKFKNKWEDPNYKNLKYMGRKTDDLSVIKFNDDITITDIPLKAYNYVVNGKAAIDWILDQYRKKKNKESGIIDDPNDFSSNPKYIFILLLKIINVSIQSVDLINRLPKMQIIDYDWRKH